MPSGRATDQPAIGSAACAVVLAAPGLADVRVLIAEDNPVNSAILQVYLGEFGCSIEVAETGAQAVQLFQVGGFDAILMDCQMPVMDGLTATRIIRAYETCEQRSPLPIIALTANANRDERAACLAAGMNECLAKPYSDGQLAAVMAKWLPDRRRTTARLGMAQPVTNGPDARFPGVCALVRDFDLDVAGELLSIFVEECRRCDAQLERDCAVGDNAGLRSIAHRIAGGASMIHAHDLAAIARDVEAKCGERDAIGGLEVARLRDAICTAREMFAPLADRSSLEQFVAECGQQRNPNRL